MITSDEFSQAATSLIEAGRLIHARGWVPATSGNFSLRLADGRIAITVSGRHKGRLEAKDIMLIDAEARALDDKKPSAEAGLHTALYRRFPETRAVLHPHSLNATVISRLIETDLVLENYELLKAFKGIETHATRLTVPMFDNDQDIPRLAARVDDYLVENPGTHAYLIKGHGLYTWAESIDRALNYLEALDFLFDCEIRLHGVKTP